MDLPASPTHSSTEDGENDPAMINEEQWGNQHQRDEEQASPSPEGVEGETSSSLQAQKKSTSIQKRRRVTRACDECRRKKIKCDGKQPCTHCTVYSYDCTYDQPSNRRRNPAPQYIEALESRLQRAEALLRTVLPGVDLNDPNLDVNLPQNMQASETSQPPRAARPRQATSAADLHRGHQDGDGDTDSMLESMVQKTGSIDLDDQGYWDFRGHSSGVAFLRRLREQYPDLMGGSQNYHHMLPFRKSRPLSEIIDSPKSSIASSFDPTLPNTHDLPSKDCARHLCENALDDACALLYFVHQPSFYNLFDRVFDQSPETFGNEEHRFLPLLYMVMALGCLFAKDEQSKLLGQGYENATDQGFSYFKASRSMMEVTDCRDLTSLQAVLFMVMFLQCSAKLAICYSYIGIALRSALRMGLHRSISNNFNSIEHEIRKRIFFVIRQMDTYVSAMLGLPRMLNDEDIDQEFPVEADDASITVDGILPVRPGQIHPVSASNAHTKLVQVLDKTVRYVYPTKSLELVHSNSGQSYAVSHARVREIERDLQNWMDDLPEKLKPNADASPLLARAQQLLRMAYAYVQMTLYRPFLHYVSQSYQSKAIDKRSYACAAACVSVSRNIVHITAEMKKRGLLIGGYWFTMYTTYFAILALVFFVLENPESPTSQDILRDAYEGRDTLASLAPRSMAADRCMMMLANLFEQLPERVRKDRMSSTSKKRHAPSQMSSTEPAAMQSAPDLAKQRHTNDDSSSNVRRATTFPIHPTTPTRKKAPVPLDISLRLFQGPNVDFAYRRSSQDAQTPTTSHAPTGTNDNGISYAAPQQPQFGHPANFGGNPVPDVNAMMFPNPDPFAYPNQPMTILENGNHTTKQEPPFNPYPGNPNNFPATPTNSTVPYDSLEAQMFGSMPSYLMSGQQAPMATGNTNGPAQMTMGGISSWDQQHARTSDTPVVHLNGALGGQWNHGWADQGYRH